MKQVEGCDPAHLSDDILTSCEPVVLKAMASDWPIVKAGQHSPASAVNYLQRFDNGATIVASHGAPGIKGRVFYNEEMTGPNIQLERTKLDNVLDRLIAHMADAEPPLCYVASTTVDACLPGFQAENDMNCLEGLDALASIWIGNQARIAAHYDLPDNLACVAVGERRFTLFPPEQLKNLYVGPLDVTPAGQPVSLVDFHNPDFVMYPKFREALDAAQVAELEAGDAIFIPSMWWHHVESLSSFNVLVNYWWRQSPAYMGPPVNVLQHALLAIRDLPPEQKKIWKNIFDHYVFDNGEATVGHIPKKNRGTLGPMTDTAARRIRAFLLNRLNR